MKNIELYGRKLPEVEQAFVERIERDAESTPAKDKGLAIHQRAIEMLRGKGYSYRDIADWFNERGLKVNHVDVWRAHKNGLENMELFDLAEHDEQWREYVRQQKSGNATSYQEVEFDEDGQPKKPEAVSSRNESESSMSKTPQKRAGRSKGKKSATAKK